MITSTESLKHDTLQTEQAISIETVADREGQEERLM